MPERICRWDDCEQPEWGYYGIQLCEIHSMIVAGHVAKMVEGGLGIVRAYRRRSAEGTQRYLDQIAEQRERETPEVYFVQFGDRIKIGYSGNLRRRLQVIPHDRLLARIPGDRDTEHDLHLRFAHLWIKGEWFRAEPELLQFIASAQS